MAMATRLDRVAEVSLWLRNSFPTLKFEFYRSEEKMRTMVRVMPNDDWHTYRAYPNHPATKIHTEVIDLDKWPDKAFIARLMLIE